jgi:hypothetical protein
MKLPWVNLACALAIEQIEGFPDFLDFIFGESGSVSLPPFDWGFNRWLSAHFSVNLNISERNDTALS